jgi:hypothetical protein
MNRWMAFLAALVVATALLVVPASAASATVTWTYTDSLETAGVWADSSGDGSGYRDFLSPRTGGYEGNVDSGADWGGFGRSIRVGVAGMESTMACTVSLWVRPKAPVTRLNLEFIDPVTWTYIDVHTVTLDAPASGYRPYEWVPPGWSWLMTKRDVYFRVVAAKTSAGESKASFDDVRFTCSGGR